MKTILIIYLVSIIISLISIMIYERKLGVRKGILWSVAFVPGFNTIVAVWYIFEFIDEFKHIVRDFFKK
jgi:hypothetical protein